MNIVPALTFQREREQGGNEGGFLSGEGERGSLCLKIPRFSPLVLLVGAV
jgi:hypothetical protein